MNDDRSIKALSEFLDTLGERDIVKRATAQSWKASALKVLSVITGEESKDVSILDADAIIDRFVDSFGLTYRPDSLSSYKSRFRRVMEEFRKHLINPQSIESSSVSHPFDSSTRSGNHGGRYFGADASYPESNGRRSIELEHTADIISIAIRPDLTVYIRGIPFDLSDVEARKIAAVVTALGSA
jgi:hypothetical protein